jgi:tetratricopeptide (TPR) repeat protein
MFLGQAFKSLGRSGEAEAAYRKSVKLGEQHLELNPDDARAWIVGAGASANIQDAERSAQYAARAMAVDPEDPMLLYNVACTYGVLGKVDECLNALEQAVSKGWGDKAWLEHDSDLDSIRAHPKYLAIVQAM